LTGCPGPVNNYIEPEYTITVKDDVENGVVETDKTFAKVGETVTLTITPEPSYELENLTVNEVALSGEGNTRTFTMPAENVVINATFKTVEDNTTVDDGNSDGEDENPTDEGNDPVVIQYDAAGGYDGELPDGVDNIKHFQYEDGYKIELNVCTLEEYNNAGNDKTTITWEKLYFSFPRTNALYNGVFIDVDEVEGPIIEDMAYIINLKTNYKNMKISKYASGADTNNFGDYSAAKNFLLGYNEYHFVLTNE
jgi:hypothetical protein